MTNYYLRIARYLLSPTVLTAVATVVLLVGAVALLGVARIAEAALPAKEDKILFSSVPPAGSSEPQELQTMDPDGSNRTSFAPPVTDASRPEWSPDGTRFAFVSRSGSIVVSSADGAERTPIPNTEFPFVRDLNWSPDGTKIAFAHDTTVDTNDYTVASSDIYTVNIDGSNRTNLRNGVPPEQGFYQPTWSPDGTKIAFTHWERPRADPHFPGTNPEIYTVNADGTGQPTGLSNPAYGSAPDWSPDGSKIAFIRIDSLGADLNVMNADGTEQREITHDGSSVEESIPDWSPDGTKIAFSGRFRAIPCSPLCVQVDIFTIDIDGSNRTNITNTNQQNEWSPSWGQVITSTDATAPRVASVNPTNGAKGVTRRTNVRATFSEEMDPASINGTTFKLYRCSSTTSTNCASQVTNVTVNLSADGLRATLNPYGTSSTLLSKNTKYKAIVTTGAEDLAGNALDQNASTSGTQQKAWYFTTGRT